MARRPRITTFPAARLPAECRQAWDALATTDSRYASPFFQPGYMDVVATGQGSTFVSVVEDQDEPVGFFPFQRSRRLKTVGYPLDLADHQGMIAKGDATWSPRELLKASDLVVWRFNKVPSWQTWCRPFTSSVTPSPFIDISDGVAGYEEHRRRAGSELLPQIRRKARKLEREVGPLRFEVHVDDAALLHRLVEWKRAQYVKTGIPDALESEARRALLEAAFRTRGPGVQGLLSALYSDDRLVAVHLGVRSATVWHWWFPAYDVDVGSYSPGLILLLRMLETSKDLGITTIDFGRGDEAYKSRVMTDQVDVAYGEVFRPSLTAYALRARERVVPLWRRPGPYSTTAA